MNEDIWDTFHFLERNDELSCDSNYQIHARAVQNGRFQLGIVIRVDDAN